MPTTNIGSGFNLTGLSREQMLERRGWLQNEIAHGLVHQQELTAINNALRVAAPQGMVTPSRCRSSSRRRSSGGSTTKAAAATR
jgi:hypothetical protein